VKIDTRYRPELVVSKDETRYNLTEPYLDAPAKRVVATDGHRLVVLPVEVDEGEGSRYVDRDLLRVARRWLGGVVGGPTWPEDPSLASAKFPDWKAVVPKKPGEPGTVTIGLDLRLLEGILKALGPGKDVWGDPSAKVALTVDPSDPKSAIFVKLAREFDVPDAAFGVLMPIVLRRDGSGEVRCIIHVPEKAAEEPAS
jgi:hypothetical protein